MKVAAQTEKGWIRGALHPGEDREKIISILHHGKSQVLDGKLDLKVHEHLKRQARLPWDADWEVHALWEIQADHNLPELDCGARQEQSESNVNRNVFLHASREVTTTNSSPLLPLDAQRSRFGSSPLRRCPTCMETTF